MTLYHLYGLAVASDLDCPELTAITADQAAARGLARVELRRAEAPLSLPGARQLAPWMSVTPDAALYEIAGVGWMLVERPGRITVRMAPGAAESDMRAYLFGLGFGTLVHMRGLIPLHVSAILTPEGVVAYTGPSGAGKSTMVADLHIRHGWPIICDDVAVLHPGDDAPLLHAGMNRIKLWRDAVERLGIDPARLTRDLTREDKFHLTAPEMFADRTLPLSRLVVLRGPLQEPGSGGDAAARLEGAAAFAALMNTIYKPELAGLFTSPDAIFDFAASLASRTEIEG